MTTADTEPTVRLAANHTTELSDPDAVWVVTEGEVLVFAVEPAGPDVGARHLVGQFGPGELLFGTPGAGTTTARLLATGVGAAALRRRDADETAVLSAAELEAALRPWVQALWGRLAGAHPSPPTSVRLAAGASVTLAAAQSVVAETGLTWVAWGEGTATVAGVTSGLVDGPAVVPLADDGWLVAVEPLELEARTTAALGAGAALDSVRQFTDYAVSVMAADLDVGRRRREYRIQRSEARAAAASRQSLIELAEVLPPARRATRRRPAGDVVLAAFDAVVNVLGVTVSLEDPGVESALLIEDPRASIERLAAASGCRVRRVELESRWWTHDPGPMIAFGPNASPVAIVPRVGGYEIFDPATGTSRRANEHTVVGLETEAFALQRTLGADARRLVELVRGGLARLGVDLTRVVLFGSFAGVASLVTPILTGIVFNEIVPGDQRGRLVVVVITLVIVALSVAAASLARGVAFLRIQARFESTSQVSLWDRLLRLPVSFFGSYLVGDLTNRAVSVEILQNVVSDASVAIVLNGVFSLFNVVLFGVAGVSLLFVGLGLVLVEVVFIVFVARLQIRLSRNQLLAQNRTQGFTFQVLRGIYKLRVAAAESNAFAVWARLFAAQRRAAYRQNRVVATVAVFSTGWTAITTLAIVATVASRGLHTSVGSYIEFTTAFAQIATALTGIVVSVASLAMAVPLLDQVRPIVTAPVELGSDREDPGVLSGSVTVSQVVFRYYPNAPIVLDGVSLEAEPGDFVAIVGPSGAGKSSLVRLLLGFDQPEAGSILYDHKDLTNLDPAAVRRQLGTMIQSAKLLPGSIYSNIAGGHAISREEAWEAAAAAGVNEDIRAMPMGMETVVVEGASTVSGGQRQRILIARALALKPRILIFDEATSALDNVTQAIVTASLERLNVTRIVIAHRLSTIQGADRIYVMVKGRIVQIGSFDELMRQPGVFADLAARQLT